MKIKYIVPNFFTACSLISGIFALKFAFQNDFIKSGWLVAVSIVCDGLDGKLARLLDASSPFGKFFDTISDFFVFGIVPAVLAYMCELHKLKYWGVIIIVIYVFCGAFRLSRFMKKSVRSTKKKAFTGLPIPAAAGLVASFMIFNFSLWQQIFSPILFGFVILATSFLMVSQIQYFSFELKKIKSPFLPVILLLVALGITIIYPSYIYFLSILIYTLYGIIANFITDK